MSPLAALTPAWIGYEIVQLIICERYLGIKQIQAGKDPRLAGPSELVSFIWIVMVALYVTWMIAMLYAHVGYPQVIALIAVSVIGYAIRGFCGLRFVLVILTFEGAIRIGMLVSLASLLWRELFA
ncbi:MAG TPA: hypothetical protein VFT72_00920 [Opitutaceae bacterium]|nr:hypothetical protein [Opitutaceae bacterium]